MSMSLYNLINYPKQYSNVTSNISPVCMKRHFQGYKKMSFWGDSHMNMLKMPFFLDICRCFTFSLIFLFVVTWPYIEMCPSSSSLVNKILYSQGLKCSHLALCWCCLLMLITFYDFGLNKKQLCHFSLCFLVVVFSHLLQFWMNKFYTKLYLSKMILWVVWVGHFELFCPGCTVSWSRLNGVMSWFWVMTQNVMHHINL